MKTITALGDFGYMWWQLLLNTRYTWTDRSRIIYQLNHIGVNSIPLVLLVGFFAGAIIAWQAAYQFSGMVSLSIMGGQAARVIVMEMGPVLTALVIAGRVGASMTAEIGSMKVSEQLDALRTLSLDPVRYIVLPRFLALFLIMPVLTLFANVIAVLGAFVVATYFLELTPTVFFDSIRTYFVIEDLFGGLFKSLVFGGSIALIGCYKGMNADRAAQGVGTATISSFVISAVFILVSDFCLWLVLF